MLALVGSEAPFDHGRRQIELLAGLEVTAKAVERTAEAIGADIAQGEQREIQRARQLDLPLVVCPPIPTLYVEMDGTGVPVVKAETEGRLGKESGQPAHTREVKIGSVFTQTTWDKDGYAVRDPDSTTYVAAIETAGEFGPRIYLEWVGTLRGADPVAGHAGSPVAHPARYRPRWPRRYAPRLWPSLQGRPAVRFAGVHGRMALRTQPAPACGARRATELNFQCPEPHRQGTVRDDSADTNPTGAATRHHPRQSARAAHASRGSGLSGRKCKESRALPGREDRLVVTGSAQPLRPDASPPASPSRPLPNRVWQSCAGPGKRDAAASLLPVQLPAGSSPPFFFRRCQSIFDRPCAADLLIRVDQGSAQFPIRPEPGDLAFGFPLRRKVGKALRNSLAIDLVGESKVWAMAGIVRLMAVAVRGAAATTSCRNRTRPEIAQRGDLCQHFGTTLL